MAIIDQLRELIEPTCLDFGLELYDLEFNGGVLRVTLDKVGGIGIDDIATCTRELSRLLDAHDPISGHFTLEVTSPGLERTLRLPAHYVRAIGTKVKIKLRAGVGADNARRLEGSVVSADETAITIDINGEARTFALTDIERARTVFEWGPTPKPGQPKAKPAAKKNSGGETADTTKVVNA